MLISASTYGKGQAFDDKIPDDRSTPQSVLKVFRNSMGRTFFGDDSQINKAVECFQDNQAVPSCLGNTVIYNQAQKLFIVIEDFDYVIDTLPIKIDGDKATAEFSEASNTLVVPFIREKDGKWAFANSIFKDKDFIKLQEDKSKEMEAALRADLAGDTFEKDFEHPAKSYITFMLGMENMNGYTIDDAIRALDLSEVNPLVRRDIGRVKAVLLYRLLLLQDINPSALSTRPNSVQTQLFVMAPGVGIISMQKTFDPETKLCAWKFSAKSVKLLEKIYDYYIAGHPDKKFSDSGLRTTELYLLIDDYMAKNMPFMKKRFLTMKIWKWILMTATIILCPLIIIAVRIVLGFLIGLLLRMVSKQQEDRLKKRIGLPLIIILMVFLWYKILCIMYVPQPVLQTAAYMKDITTTILYAWLLCLLVDIIALMVRDRILHTGEETKENLLILITSRIVKIVIILLALISLAKMFGVDGMRMLAALGVGGIALALAGKDTVENFFGSLMIMLERPFELGDMIKAGDIEGRIEHVGLRSTKIRTPHNSVLIAPNVRFITSPVDNFGKRHSRRYRETISMKIDTPMEKVSAFTEGVVKIIKESDSIRKDFYIVRLYNLAASVDIMVVLFFMSKDFRGEVQSRENFLLAVMRLAKELGVELVAPAKNYPPQDEAMLMR